MNGLDDGDFQCAPRSWLRVESRKHKKERDSDKTARRLSTYFFTLFSRRGNEYLWKCLRVIAGRRRRIRMVIISLWCAADDWLVRLEERACSTQRASGKRHRRLSQGKWMRAQSTDYKRRKKLGWWIISCGNEKSLAAAVMSRNAAFWYHCALMSLSRSKWFLQPAHFLPHSAHSPISCPQAPINLSFYLY